MSRDWLSDKGGEQFEFSIENKSNLWDHQKNILRNLREIWSMDGSRRVLLALPTGAGKTKIGSIVAKFEVDAQRRVLWLVHRQELLKQTVDSLEREELSPDGDESVGIWSGGTPRKIRHQYFRIYVATVQTLSKEKCRKNLPKNIDFLIIDEAHHYAAPQWREIVDSYPQAKMLLLSATPVRADGIPVNIPQQIISPVQPRHLVEQKILVPCNILGPRFTLQPSQIAQDPVKVWIDRIKENEENCRTIVFCQSKKHAREVASQFEDEGIKARHVDENTPPQDRATIWKDLKEGRIDIVTNVYIGTEGLDVPEIGICMVARSVSHQSTWIQMVGRVLRSCKSINKKSAMIIDLNGLTHKFGHPQEDRFYRIDTDHAIGTFSSSATNDDDRLDGKTPEIVNEVITNISSNVPSNNLNEVVDDAPQPQSQILQEQRSQPLPQPRKFSPNVSILEPEIRNFIRNSKKPEELFGWIFISHIYINQGKHIRGIFRSTRDDFSKRTGQVGMKIWNEEIAKILLYAMCDRQEEMVRHYKRNGKKYSRNLIRMDRYLIEPFLKNLREQERTIRDIIYRNL